MGRVYLIPRNFPARCAKVFDGSMAFVLRNLRKLQAGQESELRRDSREYPPSVFEELLVNALVHRDYLVIRADPAFSSLTIELTLSAPATCPNNLTVAKIRTGNSIIRNPILVSTYIAKGLRPTRGSSSGYQAGAG